MAPQRPQSRSSPNAIPNHRARHPVGPAAGSDGPADDSPSARLSLLLDQFSNESAGLRVYVERVGDDGIPKYLGAVPFNEDLYDAVRDRWGGGRFGGRIIGQGNKYKGRMQTFEIAGRPRDDGDERRDVTPVVQRSAEPTRIESIIGDALAAIARSVEQTNTIVRELATHRAATDPTDQFVKLAKIVRDLAPPAATPAPTENVVGMMRDLMELRRELADDGGGTPPTSTLGTVIREGVAPLVGVLNRKLAIDERRAGGMNRVATQQSQAQAASGATSLDAGSLPADELEALLVLIPPHARGFLLSCAQRGAPPENYAGMVLDNVSDEAYSVMPRLLQRPDFVDVLVRVVPAYGAHREWFTDLVATMRASFDESEAEGESGEAAAEHRDDAVRAEAVA